MSIWTPMKRISYPQFSMASGPTKKSGDFLKDLISQNLARRPRRYLFLGWKKGWKKLKDSLDSLETGRVESEMHTESNASARTSVSMLLCRHLGAGGCSECFRLRFGALLLCCYSVGTSVQAVAQNASACASVPCGCSERFRLHFGALLLCRHFGAGGCSERFRLHFGALLLCCYSVGTSVQAVAQNTSACTSVPCYSVVTLLAPRCGWLLRVDKTQVNYITQLGPFSRNELRCSDKYRWPVYTSITLQTVAMFPPALGRPMCIRPHFGAWSVSRCGGRP
ncbi:hypothetical protein C8R43DRAFT_958986 [Mycena crocata]|nr:hypothetical protein C8R43DRAFT_958986 [Mycena crocata]